MFLAISNYFFKLLFNSSLFYNNSLIVAIVTIFGNAISVVGDG
jgi:hypothetical protein